MNPLYQTNDSPNAATQPTKAVNRQGVSVPRSHNTFDMSYFMYKTQHYGTLEPFFVMEGVAGDKIPLQSSHDVRTFPMSSPFLSKLKLNKDYFMVPMQAILPNSWEYIFKNPSQGDDVPDDAYCRLSLEALFIQLYTFQQKCIDSFTDSQNGQIAFRNYLGATLLLDIIFSSGSLLYNLGYNTSRVAKIKNAAGNVYSFDQFIDICYSYLNVRSFTLRLDGKEFNYVSDPSKQDNTHTYVSKHQIIDLLRQYFPYVTSSDIVVVQGITPLKFQFLQESFLSDVDLSRVFAYQLACYQYYVNPQVDFIYNSQLWRDNLFTLISSAIKDISGGDLSPVTYSINGISVVYDFTSKNYLNGIFDFFSLLSPTSTTFKSLFSVYSFIFGYNSALKFGDYFTDSRTRPYAPGDMNAPVVANNVSAIDITKSISMQRFLNSVVRLGNNFGDYLRGIFGTTPSPDYHFPKFISHQEFDISGFEVANTSESQGNLVTNLKSQDDKFAFEVEVDMPCILIGISYFIMPSVYSQTIDRHYFHLDRFDMFNPMLQFIGDQPVDYKELTTYYYNAGGSDDTFGYQSRFAEYKQRYSIAAGGFSDFLPAWAYVVDKVIGSERNILPFTKQSPYFIRCLSSDFDRFLSGLSGNSLAHDFHFIVVYNNKCVCNRPMEVNPNIL